MNIVHQVLCQLLDLPNAEAQRRRLTVVAWAVIDKYDRVLGRHDLCQPVGYSEIPDPRDNHVEISIEKSGFHFRLAAVNDAGEILHRWPTLDRHIEAGETVTLYRDDLDPIMVISGGEQADD